MIKLNMTNKTEKCPRQLKTSMNNNIRYCTTPDQSDPVCSSVIFSTNTTYSQVYGTIKGYDVRSPNSFHDSRSDINQNYVDGVSLTYNRTVNHSVENVLKRETTY